jgi:hypothetical protein
MDGSLTPKLTTPAMKNLSSAGDLANIRNRISLVSPTDIGLWGSMSVHQMLRHLTDAFACPLGELDVAPFRASAIPIPIFKWLALRVPIRWPKGVPAPPEIRQPGHDTHSADFVITRDTLLAKLDQFARDGNVAWPAHPIFGPLTHAQWMRWGYLHADHHLRQFGR